MLLLDVLIRYPTITLLLVLSFLCARFGWATIQGKLGAFLGLVMAALLIDTAPDPMQLPYPYALVPKLILIPNLAVLWLFCMSLFKDNFKMGKIEWAVLLGYAILISIHTAIIQFDLPLPPKPLQFVIPLYSASMVAHLIWTAFAGRKDDLIESRRRGRVAFALIVATAAAITISAENLFYDTHAETVDFIRAIVILPVMIWALIWLVELRMERLLFQPSRKREPILPQIDPRDQATHEKLIALMEGEHFFTEQGLTIRSLAQKMNVPEHQLRALINQGLGYRNFSDFLNRYRINFAKNVLSDPEQARLPVLTIAMDAGYNSLAPFNRAFKTLEGQTPTQFRAQALKIASSA